MTRTGLLGFFLWLLVLIEGFVPQPVTYDQRQEGKINVQVDVKDLQIVALVDSDFLGDYSYDYPLYDDADFTVKPQTKPTTAKPSSTTNDQPTLSNNSSASPAELSSSTVFDLTTARATDESVVKDTTLGIINSTLKIAESTVANEQASTTESTTKSDDKTTSIASTANDESTTKRPLGSAEPRKRCPMGFQMRSGRCFKRRHSLISPRAALMKLAPALLGKSQLFGSRHSTATALSS